MKRVSLLKGLASRFSPGRWWWGSVRVAAFFGTVNLLVILASLPAARAAAESAAQRAGQQLISELGPSVIGQSQGMLINGQRLFIAAKSTAVPPEQVLTLFERHCREGAREWQGELEGLSGAAKALPAELREFSNVTTFRMDVNGKYPGQIACIVPHGAMEGLEGLIHRLSDFATTGDLSKIGDGRFAVVRRSPKTGRTLVVSIWTEGPFSVLSMFPEHGDAPGKDSLYAPRPREAVRLLSAEIEGRPYGMRVYDTGRTRGEVLADYSKDMAALGWTSLPLPSTRDFDVNESARSFEKNGTAVMVATHEEAAGKTGVSILEMGSTGFVRTARRDGE